MAKVHNAQIMLELSEIEAGVLIEVLRHVGGCPSGFRGVADRIRKALNKFVTVSLEKASGSIWFGEW